jgi:hypothetical protein
VELAGAELGLEGDAEAIGVEVAAWGLAAELVASGAGEGITAPGVQPVIATTATAIKRRKENFEFIASVLQQHPQTSNFCIPAWEKRNGKKYLFFICQEAEGGKQNSGSIRINAEFT